MYDQVNPRVADDPAIGSDIPAAQHRVVQCPFSDVQLATVICWGLVLASRMSRLLVLRIMNDAKFTARFWKSLLLLMGIKRWMTTAYNPRSNGQSERRNLTVEVTLRALLVGEYEAGWNARNVPHP